MPPARSKRPLVLYTRDALAIVAELNRDRLALEVFCAHMDRQGWSRQEALRAIASLERRGWLDVDGLTLRISESGFAAATTGEGVVLRQPRPSALQSAGRSKNTRMPRGLF